MAMDSWNRRTAIAIAVVHTLLLAAYTLPEQTVPLRFRYWSQAYARVLFHQDWRLFAPDPPVCGCSIELLGDPGFPAVRLEDLHGGFIWKRMAANACRYAEAGYDPKRGWILAGDALGRSLMGMTGRDPRSDGSVWRVLRSCERDTLEFIEVRLGQTPR